MAMNIPKPEEFFGFRMGADRKLARWDKLVEYYKALDKESDRIKIKELGKSTEGNPFILAIISSPRNLRNLEEIKKIGPKLAFSEEISDEELDEIVENGKAVIAMGMSIHASEVGGTQMAPEIAYELATAQDPEITKILDNVVLLLIPCVNPDGNIMVVDHYNKWLGTEYEGCPLPWLYHKYVGHDNNRDLPLQNMVETKMMAELLFEEWYPLAYIDYHHYGSFGGRYYIPPFVNPADPNVDPLIWTEQQLYGGAMMVKLEQNGNIGVENSAGFTAEFNSTYTRICGWHGICGMLTESASAKLATPIYIHYHQLQPARRGRPEYRAHVNFPHPWKGGWWRLRDIVEQQKVSAFAALEVASKYRKSLIKNMRMKATRGMQLGETKSPYAIILPPNQHDPLTSLKLLHALRKLGVKVHRALEDFKVDGGTYPEGSHIIYTGQITRPYILSTLRKIIYHDSPWAWNNKGAPISTQDIVGYNLMELMGLKAIEASDPFEVEDVELEEIDFPEGSIKGASENGYILDENLNDSYKAVNSLISDGYKVHRIIQDGEVPRGTFYIPSEEGLKTELKSIAEKHHLWFEGKNSKPSQQMGELKRKRVAIYQRYYGGNIDEGWTRWLLEEYGFDITPIIDEEVRSELKDYDVLILPSDPVPVITGKDLEEYFEEQYQGMRPLPKFPPEYKSGIGEEGVDKIKEFVESGGRLILLNEASKFAIEELELPLINVLEDLKPDEFFCPGSTLDVNYNPDSDLTIGMKKETPILHWGGPAFSVKPVENSQDYKVCARFPDEEILRSGWLIGEEYLKRKAAMIDVKSGEGKITIYAFRPQFRAQTHGTFKLLFNALI